MAEPWLAIIGIGEDGMAGLSAACHAELASAEVIFGGPRHLALVNAGDRGRAWPVPFSVEPVFAERSRRRVVVLASGDPFWFGAGAILAAQLEAGEWRSYPSVSTFSLMANRLGWRLEQSCCFGLHAAPFERLLPVLHTGAHILCLLRDGPAVAALAQWLVARKFGSSTLHIMEALGGPRERIRAIRANECALKDIAAPVAVAIAVAGGHGLSRASGLVDDSFVHDGQITKRPIRALTISALAPRPGELLWDLGAGSGSISVEWCLTGGRAIAVEARLDRVVNIHTNTHAFGLDHRLRIVEGEAPVALTELPDPDAVFIGGGASAELLDYLWRRLPIGTRIVANGVTLETETLLAIWQEQKGGELLRIELAHAAPLGSMRGWRPARPIMQWSVIR
ncbi:bifunctional cobalt-precorrin-7 (C(5))-methyltransferase/cobalt-precorrin-6B (C(15))-methyltransferase [Kozakia baliensis]|uniref:bifunctional cobalt-precorrin-7 (C(5))-methyltransferase/cobalt-precorrin-6B (C(15))-methyltransferase n=1 Tax=Kozakia baliensis TaxID=153496 RepID=UPI00049725AA|nr:bifunctional cobalt-precorrin-7 (C(5))-methyltransferase/cobalt-precorrin-6B (C(15))-methyltransferase [Kozakia baliensis]